MNDKPFIITNDKETAELLQKTGFVLISKNDEYYVFENDPEKVKPYSQEKLCFTNRLFI